MSIDRRKSVCCRVGGINIGGDAPLVVQSMTNTDTADIDATVGQVLELAEAGSELVRITVNNIVAAKAVPVIRERLDRLDCATPLIGDFHFNGHKLLREVSACGDALAKFRINPGNVGRGKKRDPQFTEMIEVACEKNKAVRIGVNWGSLDQDLLTSLMDENSARREPLDARHVVLEAMQQSALRSATRAEEIGLGHEQIILSCKMSGVQDLIAVYQDLARRCDYP